MPQSHAAPPSNRSLAPLVAQSTLGLLAVLQILLVVSAVMNSKNSPVAGRSPSPLPFLLIGPSGAFNNPATLSPVPIISSPPDPASYLAAPATSGTIPYTAPLLATTPEVPNSPAAGTVARNTVKSQRPVLPAGREIKDPRITETVEAAREVRRGGDMKTALEALRNADVHEPNHPEILSEMALTYEAMGLAEKSAAEWHRVAAMGEQMAGGYFVLARSKLDGAQASGTGPEASTAAEPKPVTLGSCVLKRDFSYTVGEKVTLSIAVKPVPGLKVNPKGINPEVFLFDQFADGRVVQSVAVQSPARWIPGVVDWTSPAGAVVEMDFTLPAQTAEFMRTHGGSRKIYGYMVKLFHDYRLMGEQAEPEQLLNFRQQTAAPAGADNSLFPRN